MEIDLPPDEADHLLDDSTPKELIHKPKVAFQWPPDCLWPFMDDTLRKET
jgi:hypothetical protein